MVDLEVGQPPQDRLERDVDLEASERRPDRYVTRILRRSVQPEPALARIEIRLGLMTENLAHLPGVALPCIPI